MLPIAYALLIQLRNSNEDIKEHIGKYYLYGFCLSMVNAFMGRSTPTTKGEQFDTLPLQCRYIEHMHEGVLFRKNNF